VDEDGVTATPGRRRCHDEMQEDEADLGAWSSYSIASRQGGGRRLEAALASGGSGDRRRCRSGASWGKPK
jgi:hypothetical protein